MRSKVLLEAEQDEKIDGYLQKWSKNVAVSAAVAVRIVCMLAKRSRNGLQMHCPFRSIHFLQLCIGLGSKLCTVVWVLVLLEAPSNS